MPSSSSGTPRSSCCRPRSTTGPRPTTGRGPSSSPPASSRSRCRLGVDTRAARAVDSEATERQSPPRRQDQKEQDMELVTTGDGIKLADATDEQLIEDAEGM